MPTVDKERGVLVVRVVYDGPPMSGKTTTLRSLAQGLGVPITSPSEQNGRTLFFDWVDYVGGLFEGRQIRCQIVSVPGQRELAARRQALLSAADAVVLVADTRESEIGSSYERLRELLAWCRSHDPPVGVVVQANKRDAPDSVPRSRIHAEFAKIAPIAVVDSVATSGDGVRQAFVFSVRLALDRVRALSATSRLREGPTDIEGPLQLVEQLRPLSVAPLVDTPVIDAPSTGTFPELEQLAPYPDSLPPSSERGAKTAQPERVFVPDPMMPGGFIWPPVDGRMLLQEVAQLEQTPVRTRRGDWWASGEGWRFHSAAGSLFGDADMGRNKLIEWARLHAANVQRLSPGRTVILADAGAGRFRLWQLVRVTHALRERLLNCVTDADAPRLAHELQRAAYHLLRAQRTFYGNEVCLPCTLWTVSGDLDRQPQFVGLMPKPGAQPVDELTGPELLVREFRPLLRSLESERSDYARIVEALRQSQQGGVGEALYELSTARN
jgi:signal recognition particle receptor subunit beta